MLPNASLIIIHNPNIRPDDYPQVTYDQKTVFWTLESPHFNHHYRDLPSSFYNLTMTYRVDSSLPMFYDRFEKIDETTRAADVWTWEQVSHANLKGERLGSRKSF